MAHIFITGGSGFLGTLLTRQLLAYGHHVTNIDLLLAILQHPHLENHQGDIRNETLLDKLFAQKKYDVIFHCAALLAHGSIDAKELWSSNVEGTRTLARATTRAKIPHIVYTSSNCLWAQNFDTPVTEDEPPNPIEIYGKSKWEGEKILTAHSADFSSTIIRCPTIMDEGRLGLLAILFEFIQEGRRVWVVGKGDNHYQFIYAADLIEAMIRSWQSKSHNLFGIGSDHVPTMRQAYQYVIDNTNTGARVASLPKAPTLFAMQVAHHLRLSPLGPYHYRMIASNFVFDTRKIKSTLGWEPTLTNQDILLKAYRYYEANRDLIAQRQNVSAHNQAAKMGIIRLLKWLS